MAPEVVLLGDSIFDNGVYVTGGPDVRQQLGERLPQGWKSTLLAVDGDVTSDVYAQLERLPSSTTHLVISTGGNDALGLIDLLGQSSDLIYRLAQQRKLPIFCWKPLAIPARENRSLHGKT